MGRIVRARPGAKPTDKEHGHDAVPGHAPLAAIRPSAAEIQSLDPYEFLAVLGERVIHPGGRCSTQQLLELASLAAGQQVLDIGCGVATTTIQVAQRFNAQVTAADLAPLMRGGPALAGRAPTRLLEFIRSQPEGTSRGRHGRDAACGWTPTAITPEHTAAIKAWRARLPA